MAGSANETKGLDPTSPAGRFFSHLCIKPPVTFLGFFLGRDEMRCAPYGSPGSGRAAARVVSSRGWLPCCKLAARARQTSVGLCPFPGLLAAASEPGSEPQVFAAIMLILLFEACQSS